MIAKMVHGADDQQLEITLGTTIHQVRLEFKPGCEQHVMYINSPGERRALMIILSGEELFALHAGFREHCRAVVQDKSQPITTEISKW